jgi:hypothetical protein
VVSAVVSTVVSTVVSAVVSAMVRVVMNVVGLSLVTVILLLLPSVVQNLVDTEDARHVDQETNYQHDDEDGLNRVNAVYVVWVGAGDVRAQVVFVGIGSEVDDKNDHKGDQANQLAAKDQVVKNLADANVVGLAEDHDVDQRNEGRDTEVDPLPRYRITYGSNQLQDAEQNGRLGQWQAATAASVVVCVNAHPSV